MNIRYLQFWIFLAALVGCQSLSAQENLGYTYYDRDKTVLREQFELGGNGQKNGEYVQFTREGKPLEQGFYRNDRVDSLWYFYDVETGKLMRTITFHLDTLQGEYQLFSPDSIVIQKGAYDKGYLADTVYFFYPKGNLQAKGRILDGKRVGVWQFYHDNGALSLTVPFVSDTLNGIVQEFYPDSTLKQVHRREKGFKEAEFVLYYPDGKVQQRGTYVHDTLSGQILRYHPDSVLQTRLQLDMGLKDGLFEEFHPNGKIKETGMWEKGKKQGRYETYYDNGKMQMVANYQQDTLEGSFKLFHPSGKLRQDAVYHAGKVEGRIVSYYPNGRMESEGTMKAGIATGKWRHYYQSGVLKREGTFDSQGVLIGDFQEYTPKGKPGAAKE